MNVLPNMTPTRWEIAIGLVVVLELVNRMADVGMSLVLREMLILALFASSLILLMSYGHMVIWSYGQFWPCRLFRAGRL